MAPLPTEMMHNVVVNSSRELLLETGVAHTLVLQHGRIHVIEFHDVSFGTDREILLPVLSPEEEETSQGEAAMFRAIVTLFDFCRAHPDRRILLAGHTDSVGSDAHNLSLSRRRAENLFLYLSGQREPWARHAQSNHEVADWQRVLHWLHRAGGWDTDPGPVDGDLGPLSRAARDRFRREFNRRFGASVPETGPQREADWQAIFHVYDEELCRLLQCDAGELSERRQELNFMPDPILACGENWPQECIEAEGFDCLANRRVDLLLLESEPQFDLPGSPPGEPIYRNRLVDAQRVGFLDEEIEELPRSEIHAVLRSNTGLMPLASCPYRVAVDGEIREGTTDDEGRLHEPRVFAGDYELEIELEDRKLKTLIPSRTPDSEPCVLVIAGAVA